MKGLDKQVYVYSLETSAFYNEKEQEIHNSLLHLSILRNNLLKEREQFKKGIIEDYLKDELKTTNLSIKELKHNLREAFTKQIGIRTLDTTSLKTTNIISIFESTLSRTIGMKENQLSEDVIVVRIYHYEILKSLIDNGFMHNGEKYIYFSSSAGQIRTKKAVFIKESVWNKHKNTLTCGLSVEEINAKGGMNVNKYLAYLALTNGATTEWKGFNIDRAIVVDDLATDVHSLVDYIDRDTYEIERKEMDIEIEHTDGCGMILPHRSRKSFMCRLPFVKGLLVPFDFKRFSQLPNANTKVTDIYGKEWDIIDDNIHIIFTKSQFKMWKYYDSWEDYKTRFKQYKCTASKLNEEEDSKYALLNYQMLQTLTDITEEELTQLCEPTIADILSVGSDKETMFRVLGATKQNKRKNYFQEALYIYPELLKDSHAKQTIKNKKHSMVKAARAGKLNINGKYTFLCPDLYAFCERLFMGIEEPKGLLKNGEVYCSLFDEGKVDVLRSPHLYREHAIKNNVIDDEKAEWFITIGIYTSILDPISKMLQFDNDGDKSLVVQDINFISVAERNMRGIVPLYYEMSKADSQLINSNNIYNSLILAYGANIGEISNNITKIWNSDNVNLDVIKWLCMENNFTIDFAKTLFMPTRPDHVNDKINNYIKNKVPYFFIYAKDKDEKNVDYLNENTVNKLNKIIPNTRISFKEIDGTFDYTKLMSNKKTELDSAIINRYKELNKNKKWYMKDHDIKSQHRLHIYNEIRNELLKINNDVNYVTDVLIKYLYSIRKNSIRSKDTLWWSFGEEIIYNLHKNLKNTIPCSECGKRVKKINNKTLYCKKCAYEINKKKTLEKYHHSKILK